MGKNEDKYVTNYPKIVINVILIAVRVKNSKKYFNFRGLMYLS